MLVECGNDLPVDEGLFAAGKENITVENNGEIRLAFSMKLLGEVIGTFGKKTSNIKLGFNKPSSSVTIIDSDENFSGKALIMPVRI